MTAPITTKLVLGLAASALLVACGGSGSSSTDSHADTLAVDTTPKATELLNVGGKIFSIPSPVQTALAMRKAGLKYQKDLTAPLDKGGSVVGKVPKALSLGSTARTSRTSPFIRTVSVPWPPCRRSRSWATNWS
ncbi:MAG: hypothetical protein IPH05_16275 [Flavobacteriales bacterium]|nr:hypothetical protein [Flavobacteriales bacterium]